jgi:Icc-related predicted phosphoesterase
MGDFKEKHGKTRVGKVLEKIGSVAPGILGIAGDLTGIEILSKASDALTGQPTATKEQLLEELTLALEYEGLLLKDRQDARSLQKAALDQDDLFSKRFIYYLAGFWSFSTIAFTFALIFVEIPESNIRLIDVTLGFLWGAVAGIVAFFFGSSSGSKDKTTALVDNIKNLGGKV